MELMLIFAAIGWWFWCVIIALIVLVALGFGSTLRRIFWFLYGNRF